MDRRRAAAAAAVLGLFLLALGVVVLRSDGLRALLHSALAGAAGAAAGPGLMDSMTNAVVPMSTAKPPPTSLPQTPAGATAPGGPPAEPPPQAPCPGGSCSGAEDGEAATASAGADAAEDMRLKLIKMKERMQGETQMFLDSKTSASQARSAATGAGPDAANLESTMSGFIQKLKDRAAAGGTAGVAGLGGGKRGGGEEGEGGVSGGEENPIITNGRIDSKLDSPTLRALQRVNKEGVHSLNMSRDAGTTDGSRDKAGKGFDGNQGDRGEIPIDEVKGAFGQKHIVIVPDENPAPR